MEKPSFKLVGAPCGQHGQYTFYKALRLTGPRERIFAIGDFFFVRIWQDSELVSIGELQLLWTDRVSDQTLVSLRLYFLPENTPDGRSLHGEDEVLAISEKVVLKAEDLLSWVCTGSSWRCGLRAVWRGACTPPGGPGPPGTSPAKTDALHKTKLDFSDVEKEKSTIEIDSQSAGVVVFSYPRYCRYRALAARLQGIEASWLRDSLVAALGGYAAPTDNTRILYCKDTFEYPELEGHEFVCNHLAPRLKGRPRGRRRRAPRHDKDHSPSRSPSPSEPSSDSDGAPPPPPHRPIGPKTPRRLSLRNGAPDRQSEEDDIKQKETPEDKAFANQLKLFYKGRSEPFKLAHSLKDLSLRVLYESVTSRGGYEAVCRHKLWRSVHAARPARVRALYERFLLPFENHERRNGRNVRLNGKFDDLKPIDTIEVHDSPLREIPDTPEKPTKPEFRLRTPSPKPEDLKTKDAKEEFHTTSKPAEELNREFLESLQTDDKPLKITLKPVEKLLESDEKNVGKLFEENGALVAELSAKHNVIDSNKVIDQIGGRHLSDGSSQFLSELAQRLNLGNSDTSFLKEIAKAQQDLAANNTLATLSSLGDKYAVNGHTPNGAEQKSSRPAGRSSLRHVRVKPTRPAHTAANTPPIPPLRPDSASSSPPAAAPTRTPPAVTNFGIHHPPPPQPASAPPVVSSTNNNSDDEIVEVPYKPKTPEIIDLDEYPESPQSQVKKKKLDILKERGLEVTAIPTVAWGTVPAPVPLALGGINPPMMLNPAMQHQIMTQASLFQMYNIIPQNYANGIQPPKVIQATCTYGSAGPEKTVYGNPKDPFMPPPHILHGTPVKPQRVATQPQEHRVQDILDLTCKTVTAPSQKPAVEIVRIPSSPSPSKPSPQNLSSKNYTLIDGKAVVGSNLEITLVNPKVTPPKNRPPQKRSSNGKFVSSKTPTPPKEPPKPYPSPSSAKKSPIIVPSYQINRDDVSPTSSTGSRDSQSNFLQNAFKTQQSVTQMMDMQKSVPTMTPFMDPLYMSALYNSLAGQMDQRQLAMYREFMANQFRGYSGLLGAATPTTKN